MNRCAEHKSDRNRIRNCSSYLINEDNLPAMDDYLSLRPLENDERLIQSLISFCNQDYQPRPGEELLPPAHPRLESCRNRLNLFIDETCKHVVNASCPVNDYPQQYQLNQYHLSQQQLSQQQLTQHELNHQQQIENLSINQNSQYQIYQMNNCPQLYLPADNTAKLNTAYNPIQPYYLDSNALIQPRPTTSPCFRIVSSQSDRDCQLMEPPIIPATNFLTQVQCSPAIRQPLGEIQNQPNGRFNQQPATFGGFVDPNSRQSLTYPPVAETALFGLELANENTSTQRQPGHWRPDEVPAEFRVLPDTLMGYFQANSQLPDSQSTDERSPADSQEHSQAQLEISLADNRDRLKMIRRSRMICSQVRYSPKHLLYLNGLEHLAGDELERRLAGKPVQDQIKRIQAKNRQLRAIKCKNRDTKSVNLRALYNNARKLDLQSRTRRIKQLILDLEPKVMNPN